MSEEVYTRLREYLHSMPGGYPATPNGVEIRILKKLYTAEEAGLFLKLKTEPEEVSVIAEREGLDRAELGEKLEAMALKGLVFRVREADKVSYRAFQFFIGIIDAQINRANLELAEMMAEYFPYLGMTGFGLKTRQMRIIPVAAAIEAKTTIQNYNSLRELITDQDLIAVAPCLCRQMADTKDRHCKHTRETCLSFGKHAQFYIDNGIARQISKAELLELLELAEREGLVLNTGNAQQVEIVCCCCSCHCGVVNGLKRLPQTSFVVNTCYQARIDPDLCSACGDCLDRCPIGSIKEQGEAMQVSLDKCIGCGLCVSTCPEQAITLIDKPQAQAPFEDVPQMLQSVARERGLD